MDETEAYARCHGERGSDVRIVHVEIQRRRGFPVTVTGEEIRRKLAAKMAAREQTPGAQ